MLAGSWIMATNLMRPWQEGQVRTSTAKVRAKSSAHGRYPPAGPVRSGSGVAAAGSCGGGIGAMRGLHGLAAARLQHAARAGDGGAEDAPSLAADLRAELLKELEAEAAEEEPPRHGHQ